MATALDLPIAAVAPTGFQPVEFGSIRLREWHKRHDRTESGRWPLPREPFHPIWSMHEPTEGRRVSWAVDEYKQLVGRITLRDVRSTEACLGMYLRESVIGRGVGTTALYLFLRAAFTRLGFKRLTLEVAASNIRAVRCYERVGFREQSRAWRLIADAPALALLALPEYEHLKPYFRFAPAAAEFLELSITSNEWAEICTR